MTEKVRIGLFGGSFHPPHAGHTEACRRFLEGAGVDFVLVIPAFLPPHKVLADGASAADRFEMTRLAMAPLGERVRVTDLELRHGESRYTISTLEELGEIYPEAEFVLYVGSDMLKSFETWHRFRRIFASASLAVLAREGDLEETAQTCTRLSQTYGAKILLLGESQKLSSGEVREKLLCGERPEGLSDAVLEYIFEHGLYGVRGEGEA